MKYDYLLIDAGVIKKTQILSYKIIKYICTSNRIHLECKVKSVFVHINILGNKNRSEWLETGMETGR